MPESRSRKHHSLIYRSASAFLLLCVSLYAGRSHAQDITKPDLSKPWGSHYGTIHWDKEYYGNPNNMLWGELSKNSEGKWIYKGNWGRRDHSKHGELEFTFDTPFSFSGKYNRINKDGSKSGWSGWTGRAIADVKTKPSKETQAIGVAPDSELKRAPADYCYCQNALAAMQRLAKEYRSADVDDVRDAKKLVEEIKKSRRFRSVALVGYDITHKAIIVWDGNPWKRFEARLDKHAKGVTALAKALGKVPTPVAPAFKYIGAIGDLRKKGKQILEDLKPYLEQRLGRQESKPMLGSVAHEIMTRLDLETKQMVRLAEEGRDRLYCFHAMPKELSINSVIRTASRLCFRNSQSDTLARDRTIVYGAIQDITSRPAGSAGGIVDRRDLLEVYYGNDSIREDTIDGVGAAFRMCKKLGISVKPHPLAPPPKDNCVGG